MNRSFLVRPNCPTFCRTFYLRLGVSPSKSLAGYFIWRKLETSHPSHRPPNPVRTGGRKRDHVDDGRKLVSPALPFASETQSPTVQRCRLMYPRYSCRIFLLRCLSRFSFCFVPSLSLSLPPRLARSFRHAILLVVFLLRERLSLYSITVYFPVFIPR